MDSIYQEYANFVYKYLLSLCHEEDTAEELLQETFYQAVRSVHKYDHSCKVSTWLCQIAKHLWYQELDRRKRKGTTELHENLTSHAPSLEEQMSQKDTLLKIMHLVHELDNISKEIFFLRITGDLSFRDIGEIFDRNENWARVTFYRAKQKIMKGWKDHEM